MKKSIFMLFVVFLAFPILAQVSARKTVTLQVDADGNGKVTPGDTLRYTIVITNTSSTNLLNVQFADTGFSNQTLVAGSIKSTPVARPDSYPNVIGNTLFNVSAASGVLANDSDPDGDAVTVVGFSALSAHGGTVTVTNNGGFAFLPPAGYQGSDTFTYSISDSNGGTNSATVTLTISNMVWYVNNAGANGDGRQTLPFNTLTGAATASGTNDYLYTFQGSGTYTAGIALKNGQNLVGSGDALIVGGTTILNAGSRPTILVGSGTGVSLASNNIVHGINIGSSSGRAISGGSVLNLVISNVIATATGGASVVLTNGTVNVTLDSATSSGSADNGISLNAINGSFVVNGGSIGTAAGTDFIVTGGNGTITYAGSINNTAGNSVNISGRTGGTVTLSGNITDTATGLSVSGCSGGTFTFSGATKTFNTGANTAISLTSNTGATINFSNGGLGITTTSGNGINATGGGTVTITTGASANTISSTTGTALNVANTSIGAGGLTFQSISANGGANGIILNNTGMSGGLTVTGTVGSTTKDGSGGTIQHLTGVEASPVEDATVGVGVYLNSTRNISLSHMNLHDFSNYAVAGTNVTGFTMTYSIVNGVNGTGPNRYGGFGEGAIICQGLSGSATVDHSDFSGGADTTFLVLNNGGQSLNRITFTSCSFAETDTNGNDALTFQGTGGTLNVTVQNSTFTAARGDLFQIDLHGTISSDLVFTGNALSNNNANIVSGGGGVTLGGGGVNQVDTFTFNIANNTFRDALGSALAIGAGTGAGTLHNYSGTISNNIIGIPGTVDSGSKQGSDIGFIFNDAGTATVTIVTNHLYQYNNNGINLTFGAFGSSNPYLNATVTNNTISNPGTFASQGFLLTAGTQLSPLDVGKVGLVLAGNAMTGSGSVPNGASDIRVRDRFDVKVGLPGYAGATTDGTAAATFMSGKNGGASATAPNPASGSNNGVSNGFFGTNPPP